MDEEICLSTGARRLYGTYPQHMGAREISLDCQSDPREIWPLDYIRRSRPQWQRSEVRRERDTEEARVDGAVEFVLGCDACSFPALRSPL